MEKGKILGLTRRFDDTGRICIPTEYRKVLQIKDCDAVEIFLYENGVFIKKPEEEMVEND
ncbi:MAG: hypothetical protein FWD82_06875 [Defluviitaleaceae bacterium]|nr:hypothetical protein [Defluviitaleaceae bacterium]